MFDSGSKVDLFHFSTSQSPFWPEFRMSFFFLIGKQVVFVRLFLNEVSLRNEVRVSKKRFFVTPIALVKRRVTKKRFFDTLTSFLKLTRKTLHFGYPRRGQKETFLPN